MKRPQRLICIALLTITSLLATTASQAETIFERFAPRVLPIPIPVPLPIGGEVRISSPGYYDYGYDHRRDRYERRERYDYRDDYRRYPPPPPPPPPPPSWHHPHHEPRYYGPPPRRW